MNVVWRGMVILVAILAFQVAWHVALDLDNPTSSFLRHVYMDYINKSPNPGGPLLDWIIPAVAVGAVFGKFGHVRSEWGLIIFSLVTGIILVSAQFLYQWLVSYDMWWLTSDVGNHFRMWWTIPFSSFACWIGTRNYYQ